MIRFGIVGPGWRTSFYLRIAQALPDRLQITGVVARTPDKDRHITEVYGVPLFTTPYELISATQPDFVVTSVSWGANPLIVTQLAELGMPVLSETPPAASLELMLELWQLAAHGAKIQVAEQYWAQPQHAARIAYARSGKLGQVTQVQLSAAHGYHGISLIRRYLGIGFENPTISAYAFKSPIIISPGPAGPPQHEEIVESRQLIARLDYGDRLGVFDFTNDQYFSYVRGKRLLVRGVRGEIIDDTATYLQDYRTPIRVPFIRHMTGIGGDLEGHYLKGIQAGEEWVYHNPAAPARLTDDEIAIAACLFGMAEYVNGGEPVYSLADACQDRYLDILMEESARTGQAITAETQPWALN